MTYEGDLWVAKLWNYDEVPGGGCSCSWDDSGPSSSCSRRKSNDAVVRGIAVDPHDRPLEEDGARNDCKRCLGPNCGHAFMIGLEEVVSFTVACI